MGREVGGAFRMGNTCTPMADSCQCMAKPIQYCKVKKKVLKNNKIKIKSLFSRKQKQKQMNQFFTSGGQSIGVSASASVLPMNMQD